MGSGNKWCSTDFSTNHKPEIAVCLSDRFLGFAGLRPLDQIQGLLESTPELKSLPASYQEQIKPLQSTSSPSGEEGKKLLRSAFEAFISMDGPEVEKAVKTYTDRIAKEGAGAFGSAGISKDDKERLVEASKILAKYNPGDGSIFASL